MHTRYRLIILVVLILVTIILHGPIIFYGIPHALGNVDENDFIGTALNYGATKSLKPLITWYPAFYSYVLTLAIGIYFTVLVIFSDISSVTGFAVHYLTSPGYFHMVGRFMSLIFSVVSIILIYSCGKKYYNYRAGLFAAFLFTFSPILFTRLVWALPASTFILLVLISLFFIFKYIEHDQIKYIIWAGFSCGLAISTKYNVGIFFLVGLTALYLVRAENGKWLAWQTLKKLIFSSHLYLYCIFILIGFLLASPYWLIELRENIHGLLWEIGRLDSESTVSKVWLSNLPYIWILSEFIIKEGLFGLIYTISLGYIFFASFHKKRKAILFFPFVLVGLILIGKYQKHSLHYLLPIYPALIIVAGKMLSEWWQYGRTRLKISMSLLLIAGIFIPPQNVLRYASSYIHKDVRLLASEWIKHYIPPGTPLIIGKTSNSAPLHDCIRFDKPYYSSISEQVLSVKLPTTIKDAYQQKISNECYPLYNYIVKTSIGRTESFSEMMSDIVILPFKEIKSYEPEYLIFSTMDSLYYSKQNKQQGIYGVSGYKDHLMHLKTFTSTGQDSLIIYKLIN
ncbi:phospholipid carrier-dependent glycosyltransferase [candidate division KSB1 bacterium]|nr:phospholipid carrier-dependent glycosyltransferase [candidate division KSB1 bacterium]